MSRRINWIPMADFFPSGVLQTTTILGKFSFVKYKKDNYEDFFRLIRFNFIPDFNKTNKKKFEFVLLKLFLIYLKLNIHRIYYRIFIMIMIMNFNHKIFVRKNSYYRFHSYFYKGIFIKRKNLFNMRKISTFSSSR